MNLKHTFCQHFDTVEQRDKAITSSSDDAFTCMRVTLIAYIRRISTVQHGIGSVTCSDNRFICSPRPGLSDFKVDDVSKLKCANGQS